MANPQCENGYTKIANEIMDNLIKQNLSGQELRLTLLIMRKTYGFNKKVDRISLSQMAQSLSIKSHIRCSQIVNSLEKKKIVTVKENINGIGKKYQFNKNFEQWDTLNRNINSLSKTNDTLKEKRKTPLRKNDSTKDNNTKETITKGEKFKKPSFEEVRVYCEERKNEVDAQIWCDFYAAKGWMIGKNKMIDWRAAVRTWEKNRQSDKKSLPYDHPGRLK